MTGRRIVYLAVLVFCLIFYALYRQWLAWVLTVVLLGLPVFSLAISLCVLRTARLVLETYGSTVMGSPCGIRLRCRCKLPCPALSTRFCLQEYRTGKKQILKATENWVPDHCGLWLLRTRRCFFQDYLGLLRIPAGRKLLTKVYIEPLPVPMEELNLEESLMPRRWKPKYGGGFSENHDLRLYRPGDPLQHIHWKMSAKTGKMICREPIEPCDAPPAIVLTLPEAPEARDLQLGRLLWLSRSLLERERPHRICCRTGNGTVSLQIGSERELADAIHRLLENPGTGEKGLPEAPTDAQCYRIGGGDCAE